MSPFRSKAQRAYLYANKPEVAAKFAADTTGKKRGPLPNHVKPKKTTKNTKK